MYFICAKVVILWQIIPILLMLADMVTCKA